MKDVYYIQGAFYSIYIIQILQFSALLFSDSWEEPAVHLLSSSFIVPGDLDLIKEGFSTQQLVFYTGFLAKKERNFLILEKYLFDQKNSTNYYLSIANTF